MVDGCVGAGVCRLSPRGLATAVTVMPPDIPHVTLGFIREGLPVPNATASSAMALGEYMGKAKFSADRNRGSLSRCCVC